MRVLHWVDCYPPYRGGTETVVERLACEMAARGHEVMVVTGAHDGEPAEAMLDGVAVRRLPFHQALEGQDALSMLKIRREVAAIKADFSPEIIHLHFLGASGFFLLQTQAVSPAPILVTIHGGLGDASGGERTLLGQLLGAADWVTGVSEAMVAEAVRVEPSVSERSSVVYNGDAAAPRREVRAEPPYLFFSGRHVESKGIDLVIQAMPEVLAAHPEARLIIASDGPLRPELEAMAERLGLAERIQFVGWIGEAHLKEMAARALAILVPSRSQEGFGLVALEAALLSRPVICSTTGGLPEVVANGKTGMVVAELVPDAFAKAINALLDDPDQADALGRRAAERAEAKFGLARQVDEFVQLYRQLAK